MGFGIPHVIGKSSEVVRLVTKGFEMSCPQDDLWDRSNSLFSSQMSSQDMEMAARVTVLITDMGLADIGSQYAVIY